MPAVEVIVGAIDHNNKSTVCMDNQAYTLVDILTNPT